MESHGSVVTHLLSQVKIGMDLTKVALPTFILERRSLLEMYADYFTHPDQFVRYILYNKYLVKIFYKFNETFNILQYLIYYILA